MMIMMMIVLVRMSYGLVLVSISEKNITDIIKTSWHHHTDITLLAELPWPGLESSSASSSMVMSLELGTRGG